MNFSEELNGKAALVNAKLNALMAERKPFFPGVLYEASAYSLLSGGKRLRPVLTISAHELFGGSIEESLPIGCAIEMIHTATLIHDDLPCMDNDDYRRGKPTNHKVFGEAMAVLSGMELFNLAYDTMLHNALRYPLRYDRHLRAIGYLAKSVGEDGVIGGQTVDILSEGSPGDWQTLSYIHERKTAALLTASIMAGALLTDVGEEDSKALERYGLALGLAFQIADDILDITGDEQVLGKTVGSDTAKDKLTYVKKFGLEGAGIKMREQADIAKNAIARFGSKAAFFCGLVDFVVERDH